MYILVTEPCPLVKLIGHYYVASATIPPLLSSCDSTHSTPGLLTTHYDLQQQCEEQFDNKFRHFNNIAACDFTKS